MDGAAEGRVQSAVCTILYMSMYYALMQAAICRAWHTPSSIKAPMAFYRAGRWMD